MLPKHESWIGCVVPCTEVGKVGPKDIESALWLQDLFHKEIYKADEAYCTDVNIDTLREGTNLAPHKLNSVEYTNSTQACSHGLKQDTMGSHAS